MKLGAENYEQILLCDWLRIATNLPFFHIGNERKCSPQQGALLKRMGVKPGVSDLFIPRATDKFHGLFIELKAGKNKATKSQLEFGNLMIQEGYGFHVCFGADEAILVIKSHFNITKSPH